jgi:hypothetical protein
MLGITSAWLNVQIMMEIADIAVDATDPKGFKKLSKALHAHEER